MRLEICRKTLADETRIPLDFVKGILLRLRDKFLDQHNAIGARSSKTRAKRPHFRNGTALSRIQRKILPFLHFLNESNPLRKRDEQKYIRKINPNQEHDNSIPKAKGVIVTL